MRKKLNSQRGLTLVEMLCAVLILLLLSLMLNTGLNMAMRSYRKLTAEAETQLLLNTLVDAIADELRYARDVTAGGGTVTYNNGRTITCPDGKVLVAGQPLLPDEKEEGKGGGVYHGENYRVDKDKMEIQYDGKELFTLKLKVIWTQGDVSAETPDEGVIIRCLNPKKGGTPP